MKRFVALFMVFVMIFSTACGKKTSTWQEQYDLGLRYLSEGNYQEAIIAFSAAIEIDPKQAESYIGLADVYTAQGDIEKARNLLLEALIIVENPDEIQNRLDELEADVASGSIQGTVPGTSPGSSPETTVDGTPTASPSEVTVTATNIRADLASNSEGYGSLVINSDWSGLDWNDFPNGGIPAQLAILDRNGTFVRPYQEDTLGDYFVGDARFRYSDGIISYTLTSMYALGGTPLYFNIDGTPAFTLEETEHEYTDEEERYRSEHTSYRGSPVIDGYAVIIQDIWWSTGSAPGDHSNGAGTGSASKTLIIDRDGNVTCELPEKFNEIHGLYGGGYNFSDMSVGWCGEGLFAFWENDNENFTSDAKGYMDFTGHTVIDLDGRGFSSLGQFNEGLAYVRDSSSGMYGFIDKTGELVIPCLYESASSFSDGLAGVQVNGRWGYIDKTGETVIPFEYDDAYGAGSGLASVVMNGKCGLVDYSNNVLLPLEYDDISSFEGGVAYAIKDGLVYIIK